MWKYIGALLVSVCVLWWLPTAHGSTCTPIALHDGYLHCMRTVGVEEQCVAERAERQEQCAREAVSWPARQPVPAEPWYCSEEYGEVLQNTCGAACVERVVSRCEVPDRRLYIQELFAWGEQMPREAVEKNYPTWAPQPREQVRWEQWLGRADEEELQWLEEYEGTWAQGLLWLSPAMARDGLQQALWWEQWNREVQETPWTVWEQVLLREIVARITGPALHMERSTLFPKLQEDWDRVMAEERGSDRSVALLRALSTPTTALYGQRARYHYVQGVTPFMDVAVEDWFMSYVLEAKERNIINGYRDSAGVLTGYFGPGDPVTQCELLKLALEVTGHGPAPTTTSRIPQQHWCQGYAAQAEQLQLAIVEHLEPDTPATRAWVVRTFLEAAGVVIPPVEGELYFEDSLLGEEYVPYVEYAYTLGIVSGVNNEARFAPHAPINRAATAKIVSMVLHRIMLPVEDPALHEYVRSQWTPEEGDSL